MPLQHMVKYPWRYLYQPFETISRPASPSTLPAYHLRPRTVVPTDGLSGTCRNYSFPSVDTTVWTKFEPSSETCTTKRTVDDEDSMSPSKAMNLKDFFRIVRPSRLRNPKRSAWGLGPKYTDLQELSQQYSMNCDNHLRGDDSSCSRRISFTFAKYLDGVESGELPINTVADEQQEQQQEEEEDMDMESVVIDCRDRVLDKDLFRET
ncbi:hypothetical protein CEXT_613121 [Caerostris extrusa]|uniref:Uncharacterized protein n=1 Tax=Caerostris extrusa TaxID=172846 RepID=A0AAV4RML7_CAEEX|nr:hypothetical protein CEXT_613121 [Caerostris extrusa]